jgi:hypothetical protein
VLDDLSRLEHEDVAADLAHHREVVRDEEDRDAEALAQVAEEPEDMRLDAGVEGARRLVADEDVGCEREGARDRDALALPARELVGEAGGVLGGESDGLEERDRLRPALGAAPDPVDPERLGDDRPNALARVERPAGVWKTIWMRRRCGSHWRCEKRATSTPARQIDPASARSRPTRRRAIVDFPEPDSPTRPSEPPRSRSNETSATAAVRP